MTGYEIIYGIWQTTLYSAKLQIRYEENLISR